MKIIREFGDYEMKHVQYDHNDSELLKQRFVSKLESGTIDRLCKWLKENNQVINAIDCYDGQSGWRGTDFMIGKANLSCNGYCLSNSAVEKFINGEQDPMWYRFYDEEFGVAKAWVASHS